MAHKPLVDAMAAERLRAELAAIDKQINEWLRQRARTMTGGARRAQLTERLGVQAGILREPGQ